MEDGALTELGIGCCGCHVVVAVDTAKAAAAVSAEFAALLEPPSPDAAARLTLLRGPDGYVVGDGTPRTNGSICSSVRSLRYQITARFIDWRPDLLWLHGAAVGRQGNAILIAGPSGSGKSTLATRLVSRGFDYFGDDVVPIDPETGAVHPFPVAPSVRKPSDRLLNEGELRIAPRVRSMVEPALLAREATRVHQIIFPAYEQGAASVAPCPPSLAALELLGQCARIERDRARAVRTLSSLAASARAFRITYESADTALELALEAVSALGEMVPGPS